MSQQLVDAIRQAAGNFRNDIVNYYTCIVVAQEDGTSYNSEEFTIRCSIISSKSTEGVTNIIDTTNSNLNTNNMLGENLLINVHLMPVVDDGILLVPTIGSTITVMISTYQNPLVIQYSSIDIINIDIMGEYSIDVGTLEDSTRGRVDIMGGTVSIGISDSDSEGTLTNNSTITFVKDDIKMEVVEKSNIQVNDDILLNAKTKFDFISESGAEISGESKIVIKNSSTDLKTILTDLNTNLNTLTTQTTTLNTGVNTYAAAVGVAVPAAAAAATAFAVTSTSIASALSSLTSQIATTTTKINSLFE